LGLDLGQRFRDYSRGNKQKLGLVLAFMHDPRLLILDEPTSGLDPLVQQEVYALLRESRDRGATVFLSSHVLSEVEHVCQRAAIIRDARLVRVLALHELHDIRLHRVEIEFAGAPPLQRLRTVDGIEHVEIDGTHVRCVLRGAFCSLVVALGGTGVVNLSSHEPTLEETFLGYYRSPDTPAAP
jgi:ABC-2 type transport system ATP-binding protein